MTYLPIFYVKFTSTTMFIVCAFVKQRKNVWSIRFLLFWRALMLYEKKTFKIFYVLVISDHVDYSKCGNSQNSLKKVYIPEKKWNHYLLFPKLPQILHISIRKFMYPILYLDLWPYFQVSTDLYFLYLSFEFQCLKVLKFLPWNFTIKCCYNL